MPTRPRTPWLVCMTSLLCLAATGLAQAQAVAFAQSGDGSRIVLHDSSGPCMGQARLAEHITTNGQRTPGCWLKTSEKVLISFFDGERGDVPISHLKRLAEL